MHKCFFTLSLGLFLVCLNLYSENEMPEPYCFIRDLPFDESGWFGNADPILKIMTVKKPQIAIEVGAWLGQSTRFIASHLPQDGKIYAVDTWLGSAEVLHQVDPRLSSLYQIFLSNVKHAGLTQQIVPVRMRSLEAAKALDVMADFIYIDAAHDEESVYQDILAWHPHLNLGGTMCGDDWMWDSVRRGVVRAAVILNYRIEAVGNFWFFSE